MIAKNKIYGILAMALILNACVPTKKIREANNALPESYNQKELGTKNSAAMQWRDFFNDQKLNALIDTALIRNQELNIMLQKMEMVQSEVKTRKGEYLPFVNAYAGAEVEKVGEFTRNGAVEKNLNITEEEEFPEPLTNFSMGLSATWELDIWKKLRNSKKAALMEYFATVEGKNFMVTSLVAEIASSYYELITLDNQMEIIDQNLEIQQNALKMVQLQKQAARATELAVKRFEAEVLKNQSHKFEIQQQIVEAENRINFLLGRIPQPIDRSSEELVGIAMSPLGVGIPSELLQNRPDIKQAEYELEAAKLDTKVARANFLPSFGIRAGVGLEAFDTKYLTSNPESLLYNLVGDVVGPLINRNAIKAQYKAANARQLQAVYEYEKAILNGFIEVSNQLSNLDNLQENFKRKEGQVNALNESINISTILFQSARVEYIEVLLAQREALEAKMELVETRKEQLLAQTALYKALGGGWN